MGFFSIPNINRMKFFCFIDAEEAEELQQSPGIFRWTTVVGDLSALELSRALGLKEMQQKEVKMQRQSPKNRRRKHFSNFFAVWGHQKPFFWFRGLQTGENCPKNPTKRWKCSNRVQRIAGGSVFTMFFAVLSHHKKF